MSGRSLLPLVRLRAEVVAPGHFAAIREMHQSEPMMRLIGGVRTPEESLAYIARHMAHWREHGFGFWILFEADRHRAIGLAGLRTLPLDSVTETEFGYGFLPEAWGRGYATETATACLAYGVRQLQVPSMVALTDPANDRSKRVLGKLGLVHDRALVRDGVPSDLHRTTPDALAHALAAIP